MEAFHQKKSSQNESFCGKVVFIELHVKKIACIFEVITRHCAELDRGSVVFGFPFFSLLLTLRYSGSSFLSGWKAWLSALTSSHTWLQGVVVLYTQHRA